MLLDTREDLAALAAEIDLKPHELLGFFNRLRLDDGGDAKLHFREIVICDRCHSGSGRRGRRGRRRGAWRIIFH